mgnify:CR=1 FL=1
MKMLKKMAALLLVGVMALALLTACGDDSAPSFAQKTEDAAFGAMKQATGIQVNDADLKKLAESKIDLILGNPTPLRITKSSSKIFRLVRVL